MFLRSQHRLRESAEQLVAAAKLMPTDGARAAAAARALRDARRCRSAERWYARAVELNPDVSIQTKLIDLPVLPSGLTIS